MQKRIVGCFMVLILLLGGSQQLSQAASINKADSTFVISEARFSHDNDKIIIERIKNKIELIVYDISSKKFSLWNKIPYSPFYSRDGNRITFAGGSPDQGEHMNIYIRNADGSDKRQLTFNYNDNQIQKNKKVIFVFNILPSFSPDGKRVIFKRSGVKRERSMGGEMISDWDVYEVNIETGKERRLTNYRFYSMSQPYYLSDGRRFILSGSGPKNDSGVGPKDFREYEKMYQSNEIFIMDGENNLLKPAFTNGWYSTQPHVSWNDTIVFLSVTNTMDGLPRNPYNYDLFIYKDGKTNRLTKMQSYMSKPSISPDGSRVVFLEDKKRQGDWSIWVVNTDGTGLTKINIPWEQLKN